MSEPYADQMGWERYRTSSAVDPAAAERGRLLAAATIANDPEARQRVEAAAGVEVCKKLYPEAYGRPGRFTGMWAFLDRVKTAIPW